jgi:hypothetical protein
MTKDVRKHPTDYLFLLGIFAVFLAAYFNAWPNQTVQRLLGVCLGAGYFFWGMMHHRATHTLNKRVVLEYFFIGLLATSVLIVVNLP